MPQVTETGQPTPPPGDPSATLAAATALATVSPGVGASSGVTAFPGVSAPTGISAPSGGTAGTPATPGPVAGGQAAGDAPDTGEISVIGVRQRHGLRRVVAMTWKKVFDDRILGLAAEAGFWALVSLPSTILATFGVLGYLKGVIGAAAVTTVRNDVLRAAGDVLTPGTVASDVAPILDQVLSKGHLEVASIGFAIALWSGSTAMSDYLNTITVAYGMRGLRGAVRSRLTALWLYLCALVVGIVLLPALALGPDLLARLIPGIHDEVILTINILYWPVVAAGSVALLAVLYKVCLPVRVQWRRGLPGAALAMVLWIVFSFLVRAYLTSSFRQSSAYGGLAAPIAGLLFFYFTALAVLLGAELNSSIDAVWPVRSTADGRRRSRLSAQEGVGPVSTSR